MKIAVVILNWNGKDLLEKFLPDVVKYSPESLATVYVADNASSDDSVDFVRDNFPSVKIIQNSANGGYAKGYNDALQNLEEEIFCLINSDIEVTPNWLEPIMKGFQNDDSVSIIQPKLLDYKNNEYFEYAGAAGGFIDKYGYPYCRGRVFETLEKDENQFKNSEIFWASGACFFVKREVFNELNGFDEDFFAHMEEIDFCWRAKNNGHKIVFMKDSVVYHVGGATLSNQNAKKTFLNFRNSLFTLVKNVPKNKLFPIIFSRLVLDGVAGVKFLIEFKFRHLFAILKAHFSFYAHLNKMLQKRGDGNKIDNYFTVNSVVFNYFIQKKKYFRDL